MIASREEACELVGRIYDAAFDPALWPEVMTRLTDALGGSNVFKFDHDTRTNSTDVIAPRHEPGYVQNLYDQWLGRDYQATGNVIAVSTLGAPPARPLGLWELVDRDEFVASDFYNEWWRPQGLGLDGLFVKWALDGGPWGFCCVHPLVGRGDFDARQSTLFALIAPHLVRAAELERRLAIIAVEQELMRAGLNRPHTGVIIADGAARIVFANDAAAALICARQGLLIEKSQLSAADPGAAQALGRLIAKCTSPALDDSSRGILGIPRGGHPPLQVLVAPFRGLARPSDPGLRRRPSPHAILVVTDPERERQLQLERLRHRFGLTVAEARLALEIARGDGRQAAARRVGITLATARTSLQHIFEKVGVHRQAELVALMNESGCLK
jgi:DNA-binding CsgD family transcriptional regulator